MKVAVITSIYGDYDYLRPTVPQTGVEVDWVYVTDHRPLDLYEWRLVHNLHWGKNPRYASLLPKVKPWEYTEAPVSIWIDSTIEITSETFVSDMIEILHSSGPLLQFSHSWYDCLYEEANAVADHETSPSKVLDQVEYYWEEGHPENWGLWSTKVIVRQHTSQIKKMGHLWLDEITDWTNYATISEPYVLRNLKLQPADLGSLLDNCWVAERLPKHQRFYG